MIFFQCAQRKWTLQEYMVDNHAEVYLNEKGSNSNNLFEDDLAGNEVFLYSEEHAFAKHKELVTLGIPITANSTYLFRLNGSQSPFMEELL